MSSWFSVLYTKCNGVEPVMPKWSKEDHLKNIPTCKKENYERWFEKKKVDYFLRLCQSGFLVANDRSWLGNLGWKETYYKCVSSQIQYKGREPGLENRQWAQTAEATIWVASWDWFLNLSGVSTFFSQDPKSWGRISDTWVASLLVMLLFCIPGLGYYLLP